jgi:N-acetylmuramoyl-L-alanine amidase
MPFVVTLISSWTPDCFSIMHSSTRLLLSLLLFALCSFALTSPHLPPEHAGDTGREDVRLNIVVPGSDSTTVSLSRHRIAGNTDPVNRAFINGKEVTVYSSGAFVGLVDLDIGVNDAEIRVRTPEGDTRVRKLRFFRPDPDDAAPEPETPEEAIRYPENRLPVVAEIHARRAFLNSGSGTDRLGGARLGFLERGVRLEIVGEHGSFYIARLADNMEAYLPMRFAELLPEGTPRPRSLTGSATATGTDAFDMVTLSLSQRLPYIARMRTHPNVIEVDIFGADSNTNWITHHQSAEGIRSVSWDQIGTNHFRLYIHLEHDMHWGYHIGYGVGSSLRVQVQRPPRLASMNRPLEGMSIAVDAGHGGNNRGALGATGAAEKDIVLDISQKLRDRLEQEGALVLMTRDRDVNVSMIERSEMVIASDAQILVSIHANSIGSATNPDAIRGTSSYYRHDAFQPLARMVHHRMLELPLGDFGLIGSFNFTLNALTEMPNVLVETAFMSHPEDEMKLLDPDFQDRMAEKIVDGLRDFFRKHGRLSETYSSL